MLKRHGNILITSMLILKVFKVVPLYCHLVSDFLKSEICLLLIALIWNLILIGVHSRQLSRRYSLLECIGRQHSESTCQALNALISISAWLPNLKDSSGSSYFIFKKTIKDRPFILTSRHGLRLDPSLRKRFDQIL